MAKKDEQKAKPNGIGNQKSRMKVFVAGFEMEGGDEVMAEGFRAIRELTTAMARGAAVLAPAAPAKPALAAGTGTVVPAEETEAETAVVPDGDGALEVDVDGDEEVEEASNGKGPKRSYNFKTPTFLDDLDVSKAKKDLKEFIAEKNPSDVMNKYLVVVYFLQKYMDVAAVTVDHIYTMFDILGWKTELPLKVGKPLADLKSKRHTLTREPGAEGYKLNFKGEQEVDKMGATA